MSANGFEAPGSGVLGSGELGSGVLGSGVLGSDGDLRVCPTRVSPVPTVITHRITVSTCQQRQREHYHKCWTCLLANRAALSEISAARSKNGVAAHTNGAARVSAVGAGTNGHA